ncbi:MAG: hypothetical protein ACMG51_08565 [Ginsengibacter sp.]
MKQLIFILAALAMLSCNNSSGPGTNPVIAKSDAVSSSTTSGAHGGIITCLIDGQQKSFKLNSAPSEIAVGGDIEGPKNGLEISTQDNKEGFILEIKKSGTTKIGKGSDDLGCIGCIINYYNPQIITYTGEAVTVVVASYSQNHLAGTFSGKLVNVYYDDKQEAKNYPQFIQITDGRFEWNK